MREMGRCRIVGSPHFFGAAKMIIFNSDLDNTLIYSYRHDIGPDKKCVEMYQGREISYMTDESLRLLNRIQKQVLFVPTTTRTEEQYARISFGVGEAKYALVCNGGVLLVNGREDREWYLESLRRISGSAGELKCAMHILESDPDRDFELRLIRELFVFTKSKDPEKTMERLKRTLNTGVADVLANGAKVYVVPKALNKGEAVLRLKAKLGAQKVIASGDSEFDIPMLDAADLALAPKELKGRDPGKSDYIRMPGRAVFSEEMLRYIDDCISKKRMLY